MGGARRTASCPCRPPELHELVHWTKHPSRLDRDIGRKRFGDEGCARDWLAAGIGAEVVCADLGLRPEEQEDHAAYVGYFLKALKEDKRAIIAAAALAQEAADCLHGLQPPLGDARASGLRGDGVHRRMGFMFDCVNLN